MATVQRVDALRASSWRASEGTRGSCPPVASPEPVLVFLTGRSQCRLLVTSVNAAPAPPEAADSEERLEFALGMALVSPPRIFDLTFWSAVISALNGLMIAFSSL